MTLGKDPVGSEGSVSRRPSPDGPRTEAAVAVGIDLGGTKIAGALVSSNGQLVDRPITVPTPAREGAEAILAAMASVARNLVDASTSPVVTVGVGAAGVIDRDGTVASATDLLHDWAGTRVKAALSQALGLPVAVVNDVHAAGIGEARAGAGREYSRVLVAAVGTGIGGAFLCDRELSVGPGGVAGSVGHIPVRRGGDRRCSCGAIGHVEAFASGPSMEAIYLELASKPLNLREIESLARGGDAAAAGVIAEGGLALGEALAAAANLLDPDVIVVGGGVANMGDLLLDPARKAYRDLVLPTARDIPIIAAELGTDAPLIGAALEALNRT